MSYRMQESMAQTKPQAPANPQGRAQYPAQSRPKPGHQDPKPDREDVVRVCAYQLWEQAGRPEGQSERFWLEAEDKVKRRGERQI